MLLLISVQKEEKPPEEKHPKNVRHSFFSFLISQTFQNVSKFYSLASSLGVFVRHYKTIPTLMLVLVKVCI